MSSALYLTFDPPIPLGEWRIFCRQMGIQYSPNTIGRNVFYYGGMGGAEITFGEPNYDALPELPDGGLDFMAAEPRDRAERITVSTFFMGRTELVAELARAIVKVWKPKRTSSAPELRGWRRGQEGRSKKLVAAQCHATFEQIRREMAEALAKRVGIPAEKLEN